MRPRSAFTAFELLLVLAMLMLIIGTATPAIQSWVLRSRIDQAGAALVQMANEAKRRAADDGEVWTIRFDSRDSSLKLSRSLVVEDAKRSALDVRQLNKTLRMEFLDARSGAPIEAVHVSPVGAISPAEIHLYSNKRIVESFVTDRLTGDLYRKKLTR